MKKTILLFSFILPAILTQAQAVQMLGMTGNDGANSAGSIVSYTAGADSVVNTYNFPADPNNQGSYSQHMTQAPNGLFYGLTDDLDGSDPGYLFQYDVTTGIVTPMVTLDSVSGYISAATLTLARSGTMYGVTGYGGANNGGTIFSYVPGATAVTKLYDLPANANSLTTLIQIGNSNLYGMTNGDGTNSGGTIFQFNITNNTYTVLVNLPASANPRGRLIEVGRDTLYGSTMYDGTNGSGTLFRYIIGQASDTVLYNFSTGAYPSSAMSLGPDGLLYGLTFADGSNSSGTIFNFNTATNALNVVYNFGTATNDAGEPWGGMVLGTDSIFYGMSDGGGANGTGAVFTYNALTATYNKVADLSTATGDLPSYGNMVQYFSPPVLTSSPQDLSVCPGTVISESVSATGLGLKYQWIVSTNGGTSYTAIPGATGRSYTVTAGTAYDGYMIAVIVSNNGGADTTIPVTIDVTQISDSASVSGPVCTAYTSGATYQWYDCSTSQPVSGATQQSYTATANGSYSCVVSLSGCTDTTTCLTVTDAGINTVQVYRFSMSPNPASGLVTVTNNSGSKVNVKVTSLIGEELMRFDIQGTEASFDMAPYAAGVYIVSISDGVHTLSTMKLVRE